jgi:AAHS family benzoate transporter-like MFS transporter
MSSPPAQTPSPGAPAPATSSPARRDATWDSPRHRRTVYLILTVVAVAILFDGYDLVIYGAVLPDLLADPTQIGALTPSTAGTLASYALIGVLVGALSAGAVGDRVGRRRVMLVATVWFSVGMLVTALAQSMVVFGLLRFLTGIGVGMIVATGGAIVAEFAPRERRNLFNAVTYSGIPAGGLMASALAIALLSDIGWRGLFMIGAAPLVILLPLAWVALPESPQWLVTVGRRDEARAVCEKYGLPVQTFVPDSDPVTEAATGPGSGPGVGPEVTRPRGKVGFVALFSTRYLAGTVLIGLMSFIGLLLTYGLNTWLPQIMQDNGAEAEGSLLFLLVLNGGAIVGVLGASALADRLGAKVIVAATFLLAAVCLVLLPVSLPLGVLYLLVALAGLGTIGTQVLVYGFTANYFGTEARAAGVAWCAGFGRLGGILGPVIGGVLIGMNADPATSFYIFAAFALAGCVFMALVPRSPARS